MKVKERNFTENESFIVDGCKFIIVAVEKIPASSQVSKNLKMQYLLGLRRPKGKIIYSYAIYNKGYEGPLNKIY